MLDSESFANHAWDKTPLGPRDGWSRQLRFMCAFLLRSKQPMFVLWGPERAFIYNPAYLDIWAMESLDSSASRSPKSRVPTGTFSSRWWSRPSPANPRSRRTSPSPPFPARSPRYFDFSYTPLYDYETDAGAVIGALCISTDVTARHLAAEEIRESRETLALTVDNVTEGVALVDSSLALMVWNEPFRTHFGYTSRAAPTRDERARPDAGDGAAG